MAQYADIYLSGGFHPAQNVAWEFLFPIINLHVELALTTEAMKFPENQRETLLAEWRREIYEELADHYGTEAGYDEVQFITHK